MKMELIEWVDSMGGNGWQPKEVYLEAAKETPMLCRSCGFLIYEDKERVALALSENFNAFNGQIIIPKVAITSRTPLNANARSNRR